MPRTTVAHRFEWLLFAWAQALRGGAGFLAVVDEGGAIARIHEADARSFGNRCVAHEVHDAVTRSAARWIFFDPFDAPEYAWLGWQAVPPSAWGPLVRAGLEPPVLAVFADLEALLAAIPPSWGVMF